MATNSSHRTLLAARTALKALVLLNLVCIVLEDGDER
jgi:hypothetical protein